jgi:hypothetical protein
MSGSLEIRRVAQDEFGIRIDSHRHFSRTLSLKNTIQHGIFSRLEICVLDGVLEKPKRSASLENEELVNKYPDDL